MKVVDFKTYIPELKVWVSTIAYDRPIGIDRCSETMVFKGDENGITDWSELYFESHRWLLDKKVLKGLHDEVVEKIKSGDIRLFREEGESR